MASCGRAPNSARRADPDGVELVCQRVTAAPRPLGTAPPPWGGEAGGTTHAGPAHEGRRGAQGPGTKCAIGAPRHQTPALEVAPPPAPAGMNAAPAGSACPNATRLLADIGKGKTHLPRFRIPPHKAPQPNEARVPRLHTSIPKEMLVAGSSPESAGGHHRDKDPAGAALPRVLYTRRARRLHHISPAPFKGQSQHASDMGSWEENSGSVFCKSTAKSESLHVEPGRNGAAPSYPLAPKKSCLRCPWRLAPCSRCWPYHWGEPMRGRRRPATAYRGRDRDPQNAAPAVHSRVEPGRPALYRRRPPAQRPALAVPCAGWPSALPL